MIEQFLIEETWMEHEGGTKFYHPIRLCAFGAGVSKVVTAIHFAGFKGNYSKFRRPVEGGQVQIKDADTYIRQIVVKQKNGYSTKPEWGKKYRPNSEAEFRAEVIRLFGRTDADTVFCYLGLKPGDMLNVQEPSEDELRPSPSSDDSTITDFSDRPAAWGSW